MRSLNARLAAVALSLLAAGCGPSDTGPTREDDIAAINVFNERYLGAINDEDIATLSSLTTDGHVMIAPGRPPTVGKAANDAANGRVFDQFRIDEMWNPTETVVSGDLAFQSGGYTVTSTPRAGGNPRTTKGTFLRIYQRQ